MELNPTSHVTHDKIAIDLTVSKCWLFITSCRKKFYIYIYIIFFSCAVFVKISNSGENFGFAVIFKEFLKSKWQTDYFLLI